MQLQYLRMKRIKLLCIGLALGLSCFAQRSPLVEDFITPPESVKTSVYWYWMCGNISKEGVIKDLQEMKRVGINRVFIGHNYFDPYVGGRNVRLMSDEWWDILHTALKTAGELGIEVGMFNSPGWTQAGGPWIKPEQSMRYLNHSEINVKGPQKINLQLEKPEQDFQDVKVIAYPSRSERDNILNNSNSSIMFSSSDLHLERMFDRDLSSKVKLQKGINYSVGIKPKNKFIARSITVYPTHCNINASIELLAKVNGKFKTISNFNIDWHNLLNIVGFQPFSPIIMTIEDIEADEFLINIQNSATEGGISEIELSSVPYIENYAAKTFAKMFQDPLPMWDYYMWRSQPETSNKDLYINPKDVIDITKYMTPDGMLEWNVPFGDWTILRTGMTSTKVTNNPAGPDGTGLEVDKMNKQHLKSHFESFIGKILKRIPEEDRKTFKVVIQDSYESGGQNITEGFLSDFKAKYGYDPVPFLPTYFGKVVGSQKESDRFLWDMRRLVADKIAYEYVGGLREICHENGLTTWLENYGHWGFPAEFLQYGGQSDEVGGEYWLPFEEPSWENNLGNIENRAASSCAHIYGKNLVSAESNTCGGFAFSHTPTDTKERMDKYFSEGINNTLLHVYIQQADTSRYPGTNAWFGTEFNRSNTWFTHIDLFINYIKRCNYMLRQGLNIADIAYFIGEDVPKMTGIQEPKLPKGCQFDYINAEVLLNYATVKDGMITLPHGTSYKILVLPRIKTMRPELLKKIESLVNDGAVILGPSPECSPSLQNQPQADNEIKIISKRLWNDIDGKDVFYNHYGKGYVFNGVDLESIFDFMGWRVDCKMSDNIPFLFGHRKIDDETNIYFISNQSKHIQKTDLTFRVNNMQPELWDPMQGTIRKLKDFSLSDKGVTVPICLDALESTFIVFREKGIPEKNVSNYPILKDEIIINTPWKVCFKSPLRVPEPIEIERLQDLSTNNNPMIKYFSGNMIYSNSFNYKPEKGHKIFIELGEVANMAKVWINEQYVGGLWTAPYRLDITDKLKNGKNEIKIDVVNTWVNRLIGNTIYPDMDSETWVGMNPYNKNSTLKKSGLLGPVKVIVAD